jgi:hypothetical protein
MPSDNALGLPEPHASDLIDVDVLEDRLLELAPDVGSRVQNVIWALAVYGSLVTQQSVSHAAALIVNQSVNDGQDLLVDLRRLRGRPPRAQLALLSNTR